MSQDNEFYYVYWDQAKFQKSIPYDPSTNVPILYIAASLHAYRAFATTFEALKAPFFRREKVLQYPGHGRTIDKPIPVPEEFVAEEKVNYPKDMSASEAANADNRTVKTANLPLPPLQEEPSRATR